MRCRFPLPLLALATSACDPRIPERFDGGLRPATGCPPIYSAGTKPILDDRCNFERCTLTIEQRRCEISLTTSGCSLGRLEGSIDAEGRLDLNGGAGGHCTGTASTGPIAISLSCMRARDTCPIDVYSGPFAPRIAIQSKAVLDQHMTPGGGFTTPFGAHRAVTGYLSGMQIVGAQLAVSTFEGLFDRYDCDNSTPTSIKLIDRDSMAIVRTASAPPCLNNIIADPIGPGLIGTFGGSAPQIGRFDELGRLTASARVALSALRPGEWPEAMLIFGDQSRLLVAYTSSDGDHTHFVYFDLATLMMTQSVPALIQVRAMADLGADLFGVSDRIGGRVVLFDKMTAESRGGLMLGDRAGLSPDPGFILFHGPSSRTIAGTTGPAPGIQALSQTTLFGGARTVAIDAVAWAMHEWPADRSRILVGITELAPALDAYVTFFDPSAVRFEPTPILIGSGAVSQALADPEGRVWLLLPWSASVVRIAPAR
jgi:hypothetical protein